MPAKSSLRIGLPLLLCLGLAACGFQLKGTGEGSSNATLSGQTFRLVSAQPRNELTATLIQQLNLEGAVINDNDADYVVNLGLENFQQRNLSLTAQARSAEVELTMTTEISLREGDQFLIEPAAAIVVRQFLNDPRNVVGKTEELRLLREEMRQELAAQIVRLMSYSISADAN